MIHGTMGVPDWTRRYFERGYGQRWGGPGHGEYERRQRVYRVEELRAAIERAGLSVVDIFGNPDRAPFDPATSSAMWIVAQRGTKL